MILPPREGFAPADTGAIGLLVQRLAMAPGGFAPVVVGQAAQSGFAGIDYHAARPVLWPAPFVRRYAGGVARVLRKLRPDIIEVHNRPDIAAILARRFPQTPVMLVLHNDPQDMRATRTATQRAALLRGLARVVGVSAWVAQRMGCADVLANCLDLSALPPPVVPRDQTLLFAGRVVADKGADSFVTACAAALPDLPGWHAAMIGADRFGPDSPDTPFLRRLRPLARAAGVALLGYRPHADVLDAMARAAIVVVPSRWPEPFGLTALEAMACGAALVCSNRGGLAEVVGDAGVVINPDDPAGMAATTSEAKAVVWRRALRWAR